MRLYNTPLMRTLLEQVLSPEGDFPDGRADLFSAYRQRPPYDTDLLDEWEDAN